MTAPTTDLLVARDRRPGPPMGHCRGCHRPFWGGAVSRTAKVAESGGDGHCVVCSRWRRRNPDRPLESTTHGPARVERQGWPVEGGSAWRRSAACRDAEWALFDAPELPAGEALREVPEHIRAAARVYCANCPVLARCAAEADEHEYEGLYGGVLRILRFHGRTDENVRRYALLDDDHDQVTGDAA